MQATMVRQGWNPCSGKEQVLQREIVGVSVRDQLEPPNL